MNIKHIIYLLLTILIYTNVVLAAQNKTTVTLQYEREKTISQYISDLKKADHQDISQLFEKNGIVVSTSRGKVNAKEFFYAFLPNIASADTELHQMFSSSMDNNRYAARFHFTFKLKDGETGDGEYVDEFVFSDQSEKLSAVYMFENLKFKS